MEDNIQSNNPTTHTRVSKAEERKQKKAKFLESLGADPNVSLACDVAKISRDTAYEWRGKDEQFAKDWEHAIERTKDVARSAFYKRAVHGWLEPVVSLKQVVHHYTPVLDENGNQVFDSQGRPLMNRGDVVMIRKYSEQLAVAYAKGNLSEYKDEKTEINIHTEINNMAEQAKNDLLRDLASAVDEDEDQKPTDQS